MCVASWYFTKYLGLCQVYSVFCLTEKSKISGLGVALWQKFTKSLVNTPNLKGDVKTKKNICNTHYVFCARVKRPVTCYTVFKRCFNQNLFGNFFCYHKHKIIVLKIIRFLNMEQLRCTVINCTVRFQLQLCFTHK